MMILAAILYVLGAALMYVMLDKMTELLKKPITPWWLKGISGALWPLITVYFILYRLPGKLQEQIVVMVMLIIMALSIGAPM